MTRISYLCLSVLIFFACPTRAELLSIKLTGSAQPSCWSLEDIVSQVTAGITGDREKVMALHQFGMKHQIHYIGPYEGGLYVMDALKCLGVYGYDLCGNNSSTMCALYSLAGLKTRRRGGTGHVIPEIWFDNKWNYVDTDMFGYVYLPDDRHLASFDELVANPELFARAGRRPEPFYPWDPPQAMMKAFIDAPGWKDYHGYSLAHMMRLELRTGEKVTCYFRPQGRGRYYIDPENLPNPLTTVWRNYWLEGPVRANSMAWCDSTPASYGNAHFIYEPDLVTETFRRENPGMVNVRKAVGNDYPSLVAASPGKPASVVIEVRSPWVIEGLMNDLTDFGDNTDGAVVTGWFWKIKPEDRNAVSVSTDGGRSWKTVWENAYMGAVPFKADLTGYVHGRYSYLLRLEWTDNGGSGKVGIQGLKVSTWAELSPMALPRLVPGKNEFKLAVGNHRALLYNCYWRPGESLPGEVLSNLQAEQGKNHRLRLSDKTQPGEVIFSPGTDGLIDQVRLGFHVAAAEGGNVHDLKAAFSISNNRGASWHELESYAPDPEHNLGGAWFNHIIDNQSLVGANTRFKLTVVNADLLAVQLSVLERRNQAITSELKITHTYGFGRGSVQEIAWTFPPGAQTTSYTVNVPEEKIYNHSVTYEAVTPGSK